MSRPRRRFGQHFLADPAVIERLLGAIAPHPGDALVEIGPGRGALTLPLLAASGRLHAIEIDRDLAAALPARAGGAGALSVHTADALAFDFRELSQACGRRLRLTGNLPYNVATPLLFHLLAQVECIADMVFMLQREVAARITAAPGTRGYGRLTVSVQYHCTARGLFDVPPGAFRPPPRVDSTVLALVPLRPSPHAATDPDVLDELVRRAFSHRRKTLRNALRGFAAGTDLERAGISPGLRPEALSVAEFVHLANVLAEGRP